MHPESKNDSEDVDNSISKPLSSGPSITIRKNQTKTNIVRPEMNKPSDKILQNILNASKVLEGRFTFEELLRLDIPTFEALVNNEFTNYDKSLKEFKEKGIVNAYTKNETINFDEKALRELRQTSE